MSKAVAPAAADGGPVAPMELDAAAFAAASIDFAAHPHTLLIFFRGSW